MFNRYMMTLARESRGETQTGLAKSLGVSQGVISKYENGLNLPHLDFVEARSDCLRYRTDFFFEPGRPYKLTSGGCMMEHC